MDEAAIKKIYEKPGFNGVMGFGRRPAILVVDFSVGFTDEKEPFGGNFDREIGYTNQALEIARAKGIPVIFTTIAYNTIDEAGLWYRKTRMLTNLMMGTKAVEINAQLNVQPHETVMVKHYASAFAGTSLNALLASKGIDTVIIAGCTTSGCIRATAVDAMQNGFRPIVIKEAVGDRAQEPHEANLFDINSKYGDVLSITEVLDYLRLLQV
jgi:nicotinamidase-related amidase